MPYGLGGPPFDQRQNPIPCWPRDPCTARRDVLGGSQTSRQTDLVHLIVEREIEPPPKFRYCMLARNPYRPGALCPPDIAIDDLLGPAGQFRVGFGRYACATDRELDTRRPLLDYEPRGFPAPDPLRLRRPPNLVKLSPIASTILIPHRGAKPRTKENSDCDAIGSPTPSSRFDSSRGSARVIPAHPDDREPSYVTFLRKWRRPFSPYEIAEPAAPRVGVSALAGRSCSA